MDRIKEILNQLTAYENGNYHNNQALSEDQKLEKQLMSVIRDFSKPGGCWRLNSYFKKKFESGFIKSEKRYKYLTNCIKLLGLKIQKEIAGVKGEQEVGYQLRLIARPYKHLSNITLRVDDVLAECDHIVITSSALFVVEVKTTKYNVIIDEEGNYYTQSEQRTNFQKNVLEQLNNQEIALKQILENNEFPDVPIKRIVVFVNDNLGISNQCSYINACGKCRLPYVIANYHGDYVISENTMERLYALIRENNSEEVYNAEFGFDLNEFKQAFAEAIVEIETNEVTEQDKTKPEVTEKKKIDSKNKSIVKKAKAIAKKFFSSLNKWAAVVGAVITSIVIRSSSK